MYAPHWTLSATSCAAAVLLSACDPVVAPAIPADSTPEAHVNHVVARWNGGQVHLDDLEAALQKELRQMDIQYQLDRYERLHHALDGMIEDTLLQRELTRRGMTSREELFRVEVDDKLGEPTEEELQEDYKRFLETMPNVTYEAARPHLRKQLLEQRRQDRHEQFLHELREHSGLTVDFPFPEIPRVDVEVDAWDPTLGSAEAPVTIIQFGGYQCYYCRRVADTMTKLVQAHPGDVRLVYKDFPLAGHTSARTAAVAAHCAGAQGRYWQMSELLLRNQNRLERDHLEEYARQLELDVAAWAECTEDATWHRRVEQSVHEGREAGVTSTPTFFFNGLMLTGAHSYERFDALVDQELRRLGRL